MNSLNSSIQSHQTQGTHKAQGAPDVHGAHSTEGTRKTQNAQPANPVQTSKVEGALGTISSAIKDGLHGTEQHTEHSVHGTGEQLLHAFHQAEEPLEVIAEGFVQAGETVARAAEAILAASEAAAEGVEAAVEGIGSGSEAASAASEAAEGAVGIAEGVVAAGSTVIAGIGMIKSGIKIAQDVKLDKTVNHDLKKLNEQKKEIEDQIKTAMDTAQPTLMEQLNNLDIKISAIKTQQSQRILSSTLGHVSVAGDIAKSAVSIATAAGSEISSSVFPGISLIQQAVMAPLNVAQLSRMGTALARVESNTSQSYQILNNLKTEKEAATATAKKLDETKKADESKKLDETKKSDQVDAAKKADEAKNTQDAQKTETTQKAPKSLFQTIRDNIQKVLRKETSDKTKAVVGTLLGVGAGLASLLALATPVGWAILGISLAVGIGYGIYKAVRDGRHKEKVETNTTALKTVMNLANLAKTDTDQKLTINDMLKMPRDQIQTVLTQAKQSATNKVGSQIDIKYLSEGGLSPKYETKLLVGISSETVMKWITDIKGRDETVIDYQIKELYDDINTSTTKSDDTKTQELNALYTWVADVSMNKGNEDEIKLWLQDGFDGLHSYKSPFNNLLGLGGH